MRIANQPPVSNYLPDIQKFIQVAEALERIDPDTIKSIMVETKKGSAHKDIETLQNLRIAIHTACDALVAPVPELKKMGIYTHDAIATWSAGPINESGEITIDKGPFPTPELLGYVSPKHGIVGSDEHGNEIIRGLVKPDRSVDWTSKLEKDRFEKANLFVDQYFDITTINENYWDRRMEDWDRDYHDKMKRYFTVDTGMDDENKIVEMVLTLEFRPGSPEIRFADFDGEDIISQVNEMERLICENAASTESPSP